MLHRLTAGHTDIIGSCGQIGESVDQRLRECQGLLQTVIVQGGRHIVRRMIFHMTASGEEKHGDLCGYKRRMITRTVTVGRTTDIQFGLFGYLLDDRLEVSAGTGA